MGSDAIFVYLIDLSILVQNIVLHTTCVQIKNKVHHVNKLIEPDLMMCIHITFSKSDHSTPLHALHLPIQNILLAVNPFHCFFAKNLWAGKK